MQKFLIATFLFTLGLVLGIYVVVESKNASGDHLDPCLVGDVNADQVIDLSDPVWLLNYIFRKTAPPIPCDSSAPIATFLPNLGATTVVLVRHAEDEGPERNLSEAGIARADLLADILRHEPVTHSISSEAARTKQTVAPLAVAKGLQTEFIASAGDVVDRIGLLDPGSFVVVAHHSFTIHSILEGLGIADARDTIEINWHDHFFLVVRTPEQIAQLVELKYGDPQPEN